MLCDHVVEATPAQRRRITELQTIARRVVKHMLHTFPHELAWRQLRKWWNARVLLGPSENNAVFVPDSGCLVVGVPRDGGRLETLVARMMLALSRGASGGKLCVDIHAAMLREMTSVLKIPVALTCEDSEEFALLTTTACPECLWDHGAPTSCFTTRTSWPELIGLDMQTARQYFKGRRVEIAPVDALHYRPAAKGVIRIAYEPRTGLITHPAPHLGTAPIPERGSTNQCFSQPDATSESPCIGAPPVAPAAWTKYKGELITTVIDELRLTYPHAIIEPHPSTAAISSDRRPDRIRVRFDPKTARVNFIPTIG